MVGIPIMDWYLGGLSYKSKAPLSAAQQWDERWEEIQQVEVLVGCFKLVYMAV